MKSTPFHPMCGTDSPVSGKNRVTITAVSDGASMEGEAREAFAAIPGFAAAGKLAPFILILSDNNTKLSGRIDKESYSMAPTFSASLSRSLCVSTTITWLAPLSTDAQAAISQTGPAP